MPRRIAVLAALAFVPFALPDDCEADVGPRRARPKSAPVAVTSPLASQRLIAGESIVLVWKALPELDRYPWLEEWEAFLSLDGGATYPVRLTPHLDLGQRSFAARIPEMPTRQARLMLRFGDERRELKVEVPESFEILPARRSDPQPAHLARGRGESARPGDAGVAIWVEGSRGGHAARQVVAVNRGAEIDGIETPGLLGVPPVGPAPAPPQLAAARLSTHPLAGLFPASSNPPASPQSAATFERRRRGCRQNE